MKLTCEGISDIFFLPRLTQSSSVTTWRRAGNREIVVSLFGLRPCAGLAMSNAPFSQLGGSRAGLCLSREPHLQIVSAEHRSAAQKLRALSPF